MPIIIQSRRFFPK
ncbi:MAG TPA: hypothetical protein EYQ58_03855 [Candidatus Poseidoniales archaeon]|nr:hypothetical protein [Candidatus Poseidoniales archaeon]